MVNGSPSQRPHHFLIFIFIFSLHHFLHTTSYYSCNEHNYTRARKTQGRHKGGKERGEEKIGRGGGLITLGLLHLLGCSWVAKLVYNLALEWRLNNLALARGERWE